MRQYFELSSKVIGLLLVCYAIVMCLQIIPLFWHKPEVARFMPQSIANTRIGRLTAQEAQQIATYTWHYALEHLVLVSIVPALLGIYLMRSNNLAVRFCYPLPAEGKEPPGGSDLEEPSLPPDAEKTEGDAKYAPPGYS